LCFSGRPIFTLHASAPNIPPPGFKPQQRRTQTIFSWNEDFIITSDEINHSVTIFDSRVRLLKSVQVQESLAQRLIQQFFG
jgi:hypothetical protein